MLCVTAADPDLFSFLCTGSCLRLLPLSIVMTECRDLFFSTQKFSTYFTFNARTSPTFRTRRRDSGYLFFCVAFCWYFSGFDMLCVTAADPDLFSFLCTGSCPRLLPLSIVMPQCRDLFSSTQDFSAYFTFYTCTSPTFRTRCRNFFHIFFCVAFCLYFSGFDMLCVTAADPDLFSFLCTGSCPRLLPLSIVMAQCRDLFFST